MYDLRSFLTEMEKDQDQFVKVKKEVDQKFELTSVIEKLQFENKYPMVYFDKVKGHDIPVVSNVFADRERIAKAFDTTSEDLNRIVR